MALWLTSLGLAKTCPVDFIWSSWPLLQCARIILRASERGVGARQACICALIALWGTRLTLNFVLRGGVGHEDWRYTAMRSQFGAHFWWVSLFSVFIGQSVFMFAACLPFCGALLSPTSPFPAASDLAGVCTCVAGILLELFADKQMDAFQAARRDHRMDAIVIDRSLWLCSRHPNYFGQMMRWWGVWMFSAQLSWELAWPCAITFLFNFISVKLLEDRQLENKGDAFRAYQRHVPSSLLPIPPMLSRLLVPP